jgi:hypothetical protein
VAIGLSNGLDSELHVEVAPSAYAAAESEILDFEFYEKIREGTDRPPLSVPLTMRVSV